MAERSLEMLSLDQLEKEVTCGICQEQYTEPKALPCLHYYCKQCIHKLALRAGKGGPFSCPECRSETRLTEGGVDELKSAFFIERFKSMFSTMEQARGKVEVKCEACTSGAVGTSFCRQCALFICSTCAGVHKTMKTVFDGHEVMSISDLKEGRAGANIAIKEPYDHKSKCSTHKKSLKVYCFQCNTLICRDCTVVDHRDHNFQFCAVTAPKVKEELVKELEPLRQVGNRLSQTVEWVKSTRQEVEVQGEAVVQTINTSFDQLVQIVEKRRRELLEEAGRRVQEKVDKLAVQEKTLTLASAEIQSVSDYTERCIGHCADNELMSVYGDIKGQIKKKTEQFNTVDCSLKPVVDCDVGVEVRCSEEIQQVCQTKAKLIQKLFIDPAKCTVRGRLTTDVHQTVAVTLSVTCSKDLLARHGVTVGGKLQSLFNKSAVDCDVDQSGPGEYRIRYTPTIRGRHDLYITVNGQQVAGSPFRVFVYIHPMQLGKPVRILTGLNSPQAVSINSAGHVAVGQCGGRNAVLFFKDVSKLKSISESLHQNVLDLRGMSHDSDDNLYLSFSLSNVLVKLDKDGNVIRNVVGGSNFGIAVVKNEVWACPNSINGAIMIYDKQLNFVRNIFVSGLGQLRDISCDSSGNIHVTDRDYKCIRVFSSHGVYLHFYGSNDKGECILSRPLGLCIFGQYVYVCNNGLSKNDHFICVFSTGGRYVTRFGHIGHSEGEFETPKSVCADEDGFIYVCDTKNNRIQIF